MNDDPRPLRLRPERTGPPPCSQCGGSGLLLIGPPKLVLVRCICAAGMTPGLWTGPIHPDDWAMLDGLAERKSTRTIGGENVAKTA